MTRDEFLKIWLCSGWCLLLSLGRCWIAGACSSLCRPQFRLYDISKLAFQRQRVRPIKFCTVIAKVPLLSRLHIIICTSLEVPLLVALMLQDILSGGGPKKHFASKSNLCWDSLQSASSLCKQLHCQMMVLQVCNTCPYICAAVGIVSQHSLITAGHLSRLSIIL